MLQLNLPNVAEMPGYFNQAFDAVPDAILLVDGKARILHANEGVTVLLGWDPEKLRGQPIECLIPERFAEHVQLRDQFFQRPARRAIASGKTLAARHKNGSEVPVDIALNPFHVGPELVVVVSLRDMRPHHWDDERLRLLSVAMDAAASGVVITDSHGVIVWANPAVCRMTGYPAEELIGQSPRLLKSGRHDPAFYAELWSTVLRGETWRGSIINRRKDGTEYYEEQTIAPVKGADGRISHFIAIKEDVTERVRAVQELRETRDQLERHVLEVEALQGQLREQAIRDPLSGLFNRRYFDETFPRELARAERDGSHITLILLDIDHFKHVNDTHGHAVGDRVIAALGEMLLTYLRRSDLACRYGGEEFVVVLIDADLSAGIHRAEELRESFGVLGISAGDEGVLQTTISAGVAQWNSDESPGALFVRADVALYAAKRGGRNRVVAAPPGG